MNVIVSNDQQEQLVNLDADIIKSLTGQYDVRELIDTFKNFFYNKMILDVTALNQYTDLKTYELLIQGLDPNNIILLLPEGSALCTPNFLGHLISIGIYNFTTNVNGVKYLLKKSNSLKDVEHIKKMTSIQQSNESGAVVATVTKKTKSGPIIIGVRNVTKSAGATTLIYMMKKELSSTYGSTNVLAIEIDKNDFSLFNNKNMISIHSNEVRNTISKYNAVDVILVDLNKYNEDDFCSDIIYLVEPSTIRLNHLIRNNKLIFSKLKNCKVVLNQSLLLNNDVFDFEKESGISIFYNLPPLDERKRNAIMNDFLTHLGLNSDYSKSNTNSNKIFGLFRR